MTYNCANPLLNMSMCAQGDGKDVIKTLEKLGQPKYLPIRGMGAKSVSTHTTLPARSQLAISNPWLEKLLLMLSGCVA